MIVLIYTQTSNRKNFQRKSSGVREMEYILSSGSKHLKLSQTQLQPSGVNETHCLLCFLNSPIPAPPLAAHSVSPAVAAQMYFSPCVF